MADAVPDTSARTHHLASSQGKQPHQKKVMTGFSAASAGGKPAAAAVQRQQHDDIVGSNTSIDIMVHPDVVEQQQDLVMAMDMEPTTPHRSRGRPLGGGVPRDYLSLSKRKQRIQRLVSRLARLQQQLEDETGTMSLSFLYNDLSPDATPVFSPDMQDIPHDKTMHNQFAEFARMADAKRRSNPKRAELLRKLEGPVRGADGDQVRNDDDHGDNEDGEDNDDVDDDDEHDVSSGMDSIADAHDPYYMSQQHHQPHPHQVIVDPFLAGVSEDDASSLSSRKVLRNQVALLVQRLNGGKRLLFKGEAPDFWPSNVKFVAPSLIDAPSTLRELVTHLTDQIKMRPAMPLILPDYTRVIKKRTNKPFKAAKKRKLGTMSTDMASSASNDNPGESVLVTTIDNGVGQPLETAVSGGDVSGKRTSIDEDFPDWRLNRSMFSHAEVPETWRAQSCANCFRSKSEHSPEAIAVSAVPSASSSVALSSRPSWKSSPAVHSRSAPAPVPASASAPTPVPIEQGAASDAADDDDEPETHAQESDQEPEVTNQEPEVPGQEPEVTDQEPEVPGQEPEVTDQEPEVPPPPPAPTGPPAVREEILRAIQEGGRLRHVERAVPRAAAVASAPVVADLSSELHWRLSRRNREQEAQVDGELLDRLNRLQRRLSQITDQSSATTVEELQTLARELDRLSESMNLLRSSHRPLAAGLATEHSLLKTLLNPIAALMTTCSSSERLLETQRLHVARNKLNLIDSFGLDELLMAILRRLQELGASIIQDMFARYSVGLSAAYVQQITSVVTSTLDLLIVKALDAHAQLSAPGLRDRRLDRVTRAGQAYDLLDLCITRSNDFNQSSLGVPIDPRIGRLQECAAEIFNSYSTEISIRRRVGRWDVRETVTLSSPSTARPTPTLKLSDLSAKFSSVLTCLSNGSVNLVSKALEIDDGGSGLFGMFSREQQLRLVHEAVQAQNGPVFALLVSCCEMVTKASDSVMDAPLVLEVAQDTIRQGYRDGLTVVLTACQACNVDLNLQTRDGGNTLLHIAARRPDIAAMSELLKLGVDATLLNSAGSTALSLLAMKEFMPAERTAQGFDFDMDLGRFLRSQELSDIALVGDDNISVPAHRIILCARSAFFDAMIRGNFSEASQQQVHLAQMNSRLIGYMLEFMYTGRCLYPRDDLSIGVDLVLIGAQYLMPGLARLAEDNLVRAVDNSNALQIFQAIEHHVDAAPSLWTKCIHHILTNFEAISSTDPSAIATVIAALASARRAPRT